MSYVNIIKSDLNEIMLEYVFSPGDLLYILSESFKISVENIFILQYSSEDMFDHVYNYIHVECIEYPPDFPLLLSISVVYRSHDGIYIPSPNDIDVIRRISAISNSRVLISAFYPDSDAYSIYVNWMILPSGEVYRVKMDVDAMNEDPPRSVIDTSVEAEIIEI